MGTPPRTGDDGILVFQGVTPGTVAACLRAQPNAKIHAASPVRHELRLLMERTLRANIPQATSAPTGAKMMAASSGSGGGCGCQGDDPNHPGLAKTRHDRFDG